MIPEPYALLILMLGTFRVVRLIGWDTITEPFRKWLTGFDDEGAPSISEEQYAGHSDARVYVSTLIRCPWCQGWWVSLLVYFAWLGLGRWVVAVLVPFAISGVVGLVAKNLDE